MKPFPFLTTIIAVTAALGALASYRFTHAGEWLPRPPDTIGAWTASEVTVPQEVLGLLGNPQASSFIYRSPFADRPVLPDEVQVSLVSAGPFENYHDPTVCVGEGAYRLTASKTVNLDGPNSGKARVMIFRHRQEPSLHIVMYYWQQNRDGTTDHEPRMGSYRDLAARFTTGYGAVVQGRQTVIVRNFMLFLDTDDPNGVHAQHAVENVSQAIYRSFRGEGGASE